MQIIKIKGFMIGENEPLAVMSGPCVIESESQCLKAAGQLKEIFEKFDVNFIFKSSYDKANRSSIHSFRGPGLKNGLKILAQVQQEFNLPVISDVHSPEEARIAGEILDIIQIPAFLCRQTDLIVAAANTKKPVSIKKGQFMAPWDMAPVVEKMTGSDNKNIILTDRGTTFGYNNLVSDMRAIPIMQKLGYPVCYDASHSVQRPGGQDTSSGGNREFIPTLARAAVASGCNAIFIESHPSPETAKSDAASVFPFDQLPQLMEQLCAIYKTVKKF